MKTAFLFPGQGSQAVGMGEDLYREFDAVREIFDMVEEITRIHIARLCFKGPMDELTQTVNLQPAITAVNLACLAVLRKESVPFTSCAGHSLGEYSALQAAGVIAPEDTARLVFKRGELMHREATRHPGAMQAIVGLGIAEVDELVAKGKQYGIVVVANHNTATQIVITGEPDPVRRVGEMAAAKGAKSVALKVSGAWHSELIRGADAEFRQVLEATAFHAPQKEILFNVTAAGSREPAEIKDVMSRQLCSPVRWYDSMRALQETGATCFIEVGPGRVLSSLLRKILPQDPSIRILNFGNLKQLEELLKAAG
jgi:[acyl-carrier-protein] S-malonyltransferase